MIDLSKGFPVLSSVTTTLFLVLSLVQPVSAQVSVARVGSEADCPECDFDLSLEVSLDVGSWGTPGRLTEVVSMDSRGRYYVVPQPQMDQILVFNGDGSFRSSISTGPMPKGEPLILAVLVLPGDTLLVFDGRSPSMSRIGPDYQPSDRSPISGKPLPGGVCLLPGGEIVLNAAIMTPRHIGYPLHFLDRTGDVLSSFGANYPIFRPGDYPFRTIRKMASSRSGGLWAARFDRYLLEYWDKEGELSGAIIRDIEWPAPPETSSEEDSALSESFPHISGLHEDHDGRLWVLASYLATDSSGGSFEGGENPTRDQLGGVPSSPRIQSILEVLDPEAGSLIVTQAFQQRFVGFLGDGRLFSFHDRTGESPRIQIWRVRIDHPS